MKDAAAKALAAVIAEAVDQHVRAYIDVYDAKIAEQLTGLSARIDELRNAVDQLKADLGEPTLPGA